MIYSWGANTFGELGIGSFSNSSVPKEMNDTKGLNVTKIEASKYNTALLDANGDLHTMGKSVRLSVIARNGLQNYREKPKHSE